METNAQIILSLYANTGFEEIVWSWNVMKLMNSSWIELSKDIITVDPDNNRSSIPKSN